MATDRGYIGQRLSVTGLYRFGAREYDPLTGRFASPDPFPGFLAAPRSLNPYAYGYNNPARYSDPSGYDPLDEVWRQTFRQAHHGRNPGALDEAVWLFSLAYPDEQGPSNLYINGVVNRQAVQDWFHQPPDTRSWDTMPAALCGLSQSYKAGEEWMFVQDIAMLYGGLPGRRQDVGGGRPYWMVGEQNMHVWVQARGINPAFIFDPYYDRDPDNNVHHGAWAFAVGYNTLAGPGICINNIREVQTGWEGSWPWEWRVHVNTLDLYMGTAAAVMGGWFRVGGFRELPTLFDLLDIGR